MLIWLYRRICLLSLIWFHPSSIAYVSKFPPADHPPAHLAPPFYTAYLPSTLTVVMRGLNLKHRPAFWLHRCCWVPPAVNFLDISLIWLREIGVIFWFICIKYPRWKPSDSEDLRKYQKDAKWTLLSGSTYFIFQYVLVFMLCSCIFMQYIHTVTINV